MAAVFKTIRGVGLALVLAVASGASRAVVWADNAWPMFRGGPALIGVAHEKLLYALDAPSGALKWKHQTGDKILGGANYFSSTILVGSYDSKLYCLDAATGK